MGAPQILDLFAKCSHNASVSSQFVFGSLSFAVRCLSFFLCTGGDSLRFEQVTSQSVYVLLECCNLVLHDHLLGLQLGALAVSLCILTAQRALDALR